MKKPITVDEFILENKRWQAELIFLRKIFQQTKLVEEIKWGAPTYTSNQKNVLGMAAFKKALKSNNPITNSAYGEILFEKRVIF